MVEILGENDRKRTPNGPARSAVLDMRTTRNEVAIEIIDLNKWFGKFHVLRDIDLKVMRGERIVVCGPSGSGKSTLLRCINRIEDWQRGRVIVDGNEPAAFFSHPQHERTKLFLSQILRLLLHALVARSSVFSCFFCKHEKPAVRGRTCGSRNKNPGAACRPGAGVVSGVVSVNIFFWKILVTRVKRKIELPLSPSISTGSRLFP